MCISLSFNYLEGAVVNSHNTVILLFDQVGIFIYQNSLPSEMVIGGGIFGR